MSKEPLDFPAAVRQYTNMVYQLAYRVCGSAQEARDITQDTFIKVYNSRFSFNHKKSLKNWIYTIAFNTARDHYRKSRQLRQTELPQGLKSTDEGQWLEQAEDKQRLMACIHKLPEGFREILILHYMEEQPLSEITEILNVSLSLVKVRLHRARKRLLEIWRTTEDEM